MIPYVTDAVEKIVRNILALRGDIIPGVEPLEF